MINKIPILTSGRIRDIVFNVLLPLISGIVIYLFYNEQYMPETLRNYLPDALWAYALQSTILIIWDRKITIPWLLINVLTFISFESLQYIKLLPGTGDIFDITAYLLSFIIALTLNKIFLIKLYFKTNTNVCN